jgi:hypothetical protein
MKMMSFGASQKMCLLKVKIYLGTKVTVKNDKGSN